jgi:hypothetical protein
VTRRIRTDGLPLHPDPGRQAALGARLGAREKHDGYRLIVRRDGKAVRLFTRRGHDWTDRYPAIAAAAAKLRAKSFTVDGEAVRIEKAGRGNAPDRPADYPSRWEDHARGLDERMSDSGLRSHPGRGNQIDRPTVVPSPSKIQPEKPMAKDEHNNAVELPDNATAQHGNHA